MAKNIVAGDDRRKRSVIRKWVKNQQMFKGNVFIDGNFLYLVKEDHVSSDIPTEVSQSKVDRLDKRTVSGGYRDIGPYYASAGYFSASEGRDTGYRYSDYNNNEIVVGYAPQAQGADNGDWSDGGRVTVRYGFTLRLQKLNVVD
jgi:hypothetical protein